MAVSFVGDCAVAVLSFSDGRKMTLRVADWNISYGPASGAYSRVQLNGYTTDYSAERYPQSQVEWLKEKLQFDLDTPNGIVADWCEEKGLAHLAAALRDTS